MTLEMLLVVLIFKGDEFTINCLQCFCRLSEEIVIDEFFFISIIIRRITNDSREDEMEQNLAGLGRLKIPSEHFPFLPSQHH